jgi:hypothetical protein
MTDEEDLKEFGCRFRVPDNGDCYRCGTECVGTSPYCADHLKHQVAYVREEIAKKKAQIKKLEADLKKWRAS